MPIGKSPSASWARMRSGGCMTFLFTTESIIARRLATIHAAQCLPGGQIDVVGEEPQRAIAQRHVDATRMPAASRLVAVGSAHAGQRQGLRVWTRTARGSDH